MIFGFGLESLVTVETEVIATLARHAQTSRESTEAGGILIGSYRGPHVEVSACSVPLPGDVRRRYLFDRKDPGHDRASKEAWSASDHTRTLVGEWHTHPEDRPTPSWMDRRTWSGVMRKQASGPVLFLIVGSRGFWVGLGVCGKVLPAGLVQVEENEAPDILGVAAVSR